MREAVLLKSISVNETHSRAKTTQTMKNTKASDPVPQRAAGHTFTSCLN